MLGAHLRTIVRPALARVAPSVSIPVRGVHTLRAPAAALRASARISAPVPHAHPHPHAHSHANPVLATERGIKIKTSLQKRCGSCQIVRRRGKTFVICKAHPRHKQRTRN